MTRTELRHRLAYAERQLEIWMRRLDQCQLESRVHLALGRPEAAERRAEAASNWLQHVEDCNDKIDELRRELDPADASARQTSEPA